MTVDAATCPVEALGVSDGTPMCYYRAVGGQVTQLLLAEHTALAMTVLFGGTDDWLIANFPKMSDPVKDYSAELGWHVVQEAEVTGYDLDAATDWLVTRCAQAGHYDPSTTGASA